jgi:dihydroorotate dehydrogenase
MYNALFKPLLFAMDSEVAHERVKCFARVFNFPVVEGVAAPLFRVCDDRLRTRVGPLTLSNPIGLAAGFDKEAEMVGACSAIGFGHLELGTVTGKPQPGNPRPRIFRLREDRALINRMGFPSAGAEVLAERLKRIRPKRSRSPVIGVNIGKSKDVPLDDAVSDYLFSFSLLAPYADYVAVNVSSPNTQGLRQLQGKERLAQLLEAIQGVNTQCVPLFVKFSPDLSAEELEDALTCCLEAKVTGVIATNTTLSRPPLRSKNGSSDTFLSQESGGLSGAPLRGISSLCVKSIRARVGTNLAVIGVGGIFCADDVLDLFRAGADAVQVYTGLVYEGPWLVKKILSELVHRMDTTGASSVVELAKCETG